MTLELPDLKFEIYYNLDKYPLSHAPDGWDKAQFTTSLDSFYNTTLTHFSSELKFLFEGAEILRKIMYTDGPNAIASLKILQKDADNWNYTQIVFNDFDFSKFKDDPARGVSISLLANGVLANVKSYEKVVYEIPVPSATAVPVNIGGVGVSEKLGLTCASIFRAIGGYNTLIPSLSIYENTTSTDIVTTNSDYITKEIFLGDSFGSSWFITIISSLIFPLRFHGTLKAIGAGWRIRQHIYCYIITDHGENFLLSSGIVGPSALIAGELVLSFDKTFTIPVGRKITFGIFSDRINVGSDTYSLGVNSLELNVNYNAYTQDYHALGLRPFDLFKALMQKMNPDKVLNISSDLLQNSFWNRLAIMSGDNIRGITNGTIKTSFHSFIASIGPALFAGFKVYDDQSIKLEKRDFFFNPYVNCGDLGEAATLTIEPLSDHYYSHIIAGFLDQEYKQSDGKDEICSEENRSSDSSRIPNTIELKSEYRADGRGIDQLIINFRTDPTKDTKSDTENFMVVTNDYKTGAYYNLTGPEEFAKVEGVSALGRIYNIDLSPRMILLRNGPILAVPFALKKQGTVKFESSKKNSNLKITYPDGRIVSERDSISYNQMGAPLYLPLKATAKLAITNKKYKEVIDIVESKGGYVTFTYRGVRYKGFPVTRSFNLTKDNIKEFVIYLTPNNTNLI